MNVSEDQKHSLQHAVRCHLQRYFALLETHKVDPQCALHALLLSEFEKPLLEETLKFCQNNQSWAAKILGINRNTLHKKLLYYGL